MEIFQNRQHNLFSYWFPKIEKCGLPVPKSAVIQIPSEITEFLYDEKMKEYKDALIAFLENEFDKNDAVKAMRNKMGFVKNGIFSNKFDAAASCFCFITPDDIAHNLAWINYESLCVMAGGEDELVIRERIHHYSEVTPCIYDGLPLRSEFRVFYDFDAQKPLYIVDYWDFNNVFPYLRSKTDIIVFGHEKERLSQTFTDKKDEVLELVGTHMKNVSGLSGRWSVDIMLDEKGKYWLIDMAIAAHSAYWDEERVLQDE